MTGGDGTVVAGVEDGGEPPAPSLGGVLWCTGLLPCVGVVGVLWLLLPPLGVGQEEDFGDESTTKSPLVSFKFSNY